MAPSTSLWRWKESYEFTTINLGFGCTFV